MAERDAFEGEVDEIIYQNEENGYVVFDLFSEDVGVITCIGYIPYLKAGELLRITGKWTTHPSYGEQLKVEYFERIEPTGTTQILNYLASGVIKGIRKSTAEKIVDRFGEQSLTVIVETPERLAEIKGISISKANEIKNAYMSIYDKEQLIMFLQKFEITANFAVKIYDELGDNSLNRIKENPYVLCERVKGISFKAADRIAQMSGIMPNDSNRIKSGIKYTLYYGAMSGGHTYLPRNILVEMSVRMLEVNDLEVENAIVSLLMSGELYKYQRDETEGIFLPVFYESEQAVAARITALSRQRFSLREERFEQKITELEKSGGITLAEHQKRAVKTALSEGVTVITGGPGTGKTTTINFIIKLFKSDGAEVLLTAPTGRAAKRMSEVTGEEAKTVHRLLELGYSNDDELKALTRDDNNPLEADVIIVDEMSMVDIILMRALVSAVKEGTSLILVGDIDQLPSVGAGNVLKDIIHSERVPVIKLETVFRQAEESMIVVNAHRVNQGKYPIYNEKGKDFFFMQKRTGAEICELVKSLVSERLPKAYGIDSIRDIQVITAMKKGVCGTFNLNAELQNVLNPKSSLKKERIFQNRILRDGDKVMQIKNNYDILWESTVDKTGGQGVFNGDIGFIEEAGTSSVTVTFDDDKRVVYENSMLDELELAYAVTVHKSQGSEFPVVVMPMYFGAPMLMNRNLFYTAVTRGRQLVVLAGQQGAAEAMIDNTNEAKRYSLLKELLISNE